MPARWPAAARKLGLVVALALVASLVAGPAQAEPSLAQARADATRLRHQLSALQVKQEVAIERYDGLEDQLQQAVSTEISADDQAMDDQAAAQQAQANVGNRAAALYMSGGQLGLIESVLQGTSPSDMLERAQVVDSVLNSQTLMATTGQGIAAQAASMARGTTLSREQVATLHAQAAATLTTVQTLLARQHSLIAKADKTVVKLAAAQERAAEAAAVAGAAQSAGAAGVPVGSGDSASLPSPIVGPNATASAAIAAAQTRLGLPYVWGATGPSTFDCSGLVMWSYRQAGLSIPRTSREQYAGLPKVALSDLQPGDLVFYATNTSNPSTIHHVAMYVGDGLVIHAPHTGDHVRYAPVAMPGLIGAVRPTL
jgi:cell wall-associated NlpC family hydrolase